MADEADYSGSGMADDAAFPTLDATAIAFLDAVGDRRTVEAGEYLYRAGDDVYDFFVVLSGTVDIVVGEASGRAPSHGG
jgi:CRP-like cAMP-binding protein